MTPSRQIEVAVQLKLAEAREKYGFDKQVTVHTDLKGVRAATANYATMTLRFNLEAFDLDPQECLNDTVPHEIAHLVAFWKYGHFMKQDHGREWRSVCRALGGTAKRCHSLKLTKARRTMEHLYVLPSGEETWLKPRFHKTVQKDSPYVFCTHRKTRERIRIEHYVRSELR